MPWNDNRLAEEATEKRWLDLVGIYNIVKHNGLRICIENTNIVIFKWIEIQDEPCHYEYALAYL